VVIHLADITFCSFFTVDTNQLAPSAARSPLGRLVNTGASTAEIHCDDSHAASARASVFTPTSVAAGEPQLIPNTAIATAAKSVKRENFFILILVKVVQAIGTAKLINKVTQHHTISQIYIAENR
jgi:hypothetical protein